MEMQTIMSKINVICTFQLTSLRTIKLALLFRKCMCVCVVNMYIYRWRSLFLTYRGHSKVSDVLTYHSPDSLPEPGGLLTARNTKKPSSSCSHNTKLRYV